MDEKPKTRVLVVEDSPIIAHVIRFALELAGLCVTVADDGMEALSKAQLEKFDLVVTDDQMPRMNGRELCLQLRDNLEYAETPIIFVTTKRIEIESEIISLFGRETAVLDKPFSVKALLRAVEATLGFSTVA